MDIDYLTREAGKVITNIGNIDPDIIQAVPSIKRISDICPELVFVKLDIENDPLNEFINNTRNLTSKEEIYNEYSKYVNALVKFDIQKTVEYINSLPNAFDALVKYPASLLFIKKGQNGIYYKWKLYLPHSGQYLYIFAQAKINKKGFLSFKYFRSTVLKERKEFESLFKSPSRGR